MSISKINTLTQRTLVNSDVMQVTDSSGAAWYKTTLAKLAEFLYLAYFSIANTWSAKQTFSAGADMGSEVAMGSNKITGLANGTNSGDAVNKSQLDTKQNTITGTDDKVLYKTSSGVSTTSKLGISSTINAINIPKLASAPASTGDGMGLVGDIGWSGADLYLKTDSGWVRERFETF